MKNFFRHYFEEMLIGCAFVFLAALLGIFIWSVSSLIVHVQIALTPAAPDQGNVIFNLDKAAKLNLQLTP